MKTFIKTFCILSMVYFLTMIYAHWNPTNIILKTGFEIYADPDDDKKNPPDLPPVTTSPGSGDTIVILPNGEIIILED